ncbi:MAG: PaaI family thioesterase [Anaerolineae bacterium]|nr:PaaI family thioesterase [Anaerolineae bacterium]
MADVSGLTAEVMARLRDTVGDRIDTFALPPPVFATMEGEFVELDMHAGVLTARFPMRKAYLNPYGTMQGGMIAAAVDNTLGPLSMLVAPPNVTRRLEMTYSRPVTSDMPHIIVRGELLERDDRWLHFRADVRSPDGLRLARSRATHWISDAGHD